MRWPVRHRPALTWAFVLIVTTLALLSVRSRLDTSHVALVLLLAVLGASADGGRTLGLAVAGISFFVFDFLFLPPYNTLVIANPLDWLVLATFLITSIVAAQLLYRAQEQTERAELRAGEVDRLATLGAEALNAPRAVDAVTAVAEVVRSATGVDSCAIYLIEAQGQPRSIAGAPEGHPVGGTELVGWVMRSGAPAVELEDGTTRLGENAVSLPELIVRNATTAHALLVPLRVRDRTVGVLRLTGRIAFDAPRWRFLDALSYYAALAAERVRLAAEAEHAAALREADRLKDALIASVSHDLRTPLTTIKALAHDLGALGDERAQVIEEEADRLNRLVRDLLDLSRLSAGALPLRIELNAVDELIGSALQGTEGTMRARRIDVELPPDGSLLVGRFDMSYAIRILVNLLENAHKYSPEGEPVTIVASRTGAELSVAVLDRGPGIEAAERDQIFTPFYRAPNAPPDVGSAGLGLSIARRLAEAQGGALRHAPRNGGGSAFTLVLPAAELDDAVDRETFTNR